MATRTRRHQSNGDLISLTLYSRQIIVLTFLLLTKCTVESHHTYTDLFPSTYEEYDYSILDPLTAYGSPYGGFSRATRSRLAALPLYLPTVAKEHPSEDTAYMQVRDSDGRLFTCRVYHEDELDPKSLNDSMFDSPKLREKIPEGSKQIETQKSRSLQSVNPDKSKPAGLEGVTRALSVVEAERRLKELSGLCGQIHKGWWSYEWCNQNQVSQFHIDIEDDSSTVTISNVSSLGKYTSRATFVDLQNLPPNYKAEDIPELARVTDIFRNGDLCEESNRRRTTHVHYMCCSGRYMARKKGLLKKDGKQFHTDDIAMMDLVEDHDKVCSYNVTMCTPLLCDAEEKYLLDEEGTPQPEKLVDEVNTKEDESIREILDRTLSSTCLQSSTGGWWTYELCHGQDIRQYHETTSTTKTSSGATITSKRMESEHALGLHKADVFDTVPADEEWRLVVNTTDSKKGGGNGAYLEVEYTQGDICDHSDVTDSASFARAASTGGVARSSSIRYYCGDRFELVVNEDSTCHYIVEVKIPALCKHPLFKVPLSKKQVVKCLPVTN